ncbi:hypothetical protein JMJ77_0015161 [Colletotrichum scovillei]|uniref:Uncharacterized protein n=1 Tax=Colletotrichum scovillei TaxID=1209932 RepID=A0A9P7U8V1_9PEZI|nr:hypothetical protein JMJ77_0015161 [Colletotrichum scovillei]KAG7056786.1 hypothetical protein JMJ78_0000576 [Colletotrichum scovillei]KAG7066711.1 hypothetical protein JMJ76_0000563 [Colletotrichum scovillei]
MRIQHPPTRTELSPSPSYLRPTLSALSGLHEPPANQVSPKRPNHIHPDAGFLTRVEGWETGECGE